MTQPKTDGGEEEVEVAPLRSAPQVQDVAPKAATAHTPVAEAAPDLLEALQGIAADTWDAGNPNCLRSIQAMARAAIAKAEGR